MFTQHILTAFNLDTLPPEQRKQLMEKMTDVAEGRIILRIVKGLDDAQKKQFEALIDGDDTDGLQTFFEAHVPDLLTIVEEETQTLQQELLAKIGKA